MVQAIIFDLYGVLAINGWQAFKQKHFLDNHTDWHELYELGRQTDAGLASYDDFVNKASQLTGVSVEAIRHELEQTTPNNELLHFIAKKLQGKYRLGILSNASVDVASSIFSTEQQAMFDAIILSYHVGLTKPDKEMYLVAAQKLGLSPAECVFIDDQERHCMGAEDAGMQSLLYSDVPILKQQLDELIKGHL